MVVVCAWALVRDAAKHETSLGSPRDKIQRKKVPLSSGTQNHLSLAQLLTKYFPKIFNYFLVVKND